MLRKEITITPQRILELLSFQGIVDFFAELGYNTTIDSTPEKDTVTQHELHRHDDLSSKIASFRRVAQNTDETNTTLYVYFYVLKSVTTKAREDIVRDLVRRHSGEYLFILTSEIAPFKELEFVYIDRISGNEQSQAIVQPTLFDDHPPAPIGPPQIRALSLDCRHPDYKAIRLLRDLPYKHRYVLEQCKAISNAYDRAEISEEFFHNRSLFSDHYLKKRLPEEVIEWLQTDQEGFESDALTEVSSTFRRMYAGANKAFAGKSKSELSQLLFEPVLELLGFAWNVPHKNAKHENQDERRLPDYTLTMKDADGAPLAICLVYPWDRNLDDYLDSDDDTSAFSVDPTMANENPSAVVVSLLEQEQVNWAILTNGRFWRLYSTRARSRATNYYEIDLLETMAIRRERTEDALKALRYFWLFFRADAFSPKPRPDYETPPYICFLDYILRESERYARELGESLKERIFDDIFPYFARGFVHYAQFIGHLPPDLGKQTPEERTILLQPFFEGTLAFLYRLLFLLYAESRDLLPVHDVRYHAQSLTWMKEEIASIAKNNKVQAPKNIEERFPEDVTATDLYGRLRVLFKAIDQGDDELNVPNYNGGLFMTEVNANKAQEILTPDERAARFLATYRIPNHDLALGLDLMARDEDERKGRVTKREFELAYVDYKSLGVRQLGSIYEGLLEFKLRIAVERMVVLKGKVLPLQEVIDAGQYKPGKTKAAIYEPNTVYIENDRHERKATGSYYTPDYIVKYIIEQTVGPLLEERFKKLRPRFREYQRAMQNRVKDNGELKKLNMPTKDLYATYKKYEELAEELFDLKILDPAMGSGHFLVDTVDYITDKMTEFLRPLTPNPVHQKLQEIRGNIVAEVEAQNVSIDRARLNELNLLKRQVLKRCVFGVDINYMAVTLTKVSLWLDTFTQGAPLSFLDYHLKWGNSLIGTTLAKIEKESEGLWFARDLSRVLSSADLARRLSFGTDSTPKEVAEAYQVYDQLLDQVLPYKTLLDIWVSQYFGSKWARATVENCIDAILEQNPAAMQKSNQEAYTLAQEIAAPQNKNFFHWELEFPEVFFRDNRRVSEYVAGFDAVIGNPPYVRQEGLGDDKVAFKALYNAYSSIADLYTYFIEGGHKLLHLNGRFGMITANKFMRANYGAALRTYLVDEVKLERLVDFGDLPVFGDATAYPIIIISAKAERKAQSIEYTLVETLEPDNLDFVVKTTVNKMPESAFSGINWSLAANSTQIVLDKLKNSSVPLSEYVGGKIQYGVKTGFNEAFIIDTATRDRLISEDPRSSDLIKPFLIGEDVRRYEINFKERYLIFTRRGVDIKGYNAIERHLMQYRKQIEPRPIKWNENTQGAWPGRKPGPYKWYEIQDNVAYYADFEKPKIVFSDIAVNTRFAFTVNKEYTDTTTFIIPVDNYYLLSLLNSKVFLFFLRFFSSTIRGGFLRFKKQYVEPFPIHRVNFVTLKELRAAYLDESKQLYQQYIIDNNSLSLSQFVEHHLAQQPEASDVIYDLLAYLVENMLKLNKEKCALQSNFLAWLETNLEIQPQPDKSSSKSGLETLKGKDRLLNYPRDYQKSENALSFQEVENILLENKRRFRMYPDNRFMREIESEYERNVEAVEKIKRQLKLTDVLIDSAVYKLYGLNEDEVRIVEGKN